MMDFTIKNENLVSNAGPFIYNDKDVAVNNSTKKEDIFLFPPQVPTMDAIDGIKFDFNDGLRVLFPNNDKIYRCVFYDKDSDIVLYSNDTTPGCCITSIKKFYINFVLEIYEKDKFDEPIFKHEFDCKDRDVLLQIPDGALGDAIAWFSYCEKFQIKTGCNLNLIIPQRFIDIFKDQYPNINFMTKKEFDEKNILPYATFRLGLYFRGDVDHQPNDFREVGLHKSIGYLLGLRDKELDEIAPRVDLSAERPYPEKYVVIASHSSSNCKMWNNPSGWREVIQYLKDKGYRVFCIDLLHEYGQDTVWHCIPWGCEDLTGSLPLQERINVIAHADMFIGVSSGLSWLAWCCKTPIIMISGFTQPWNEFYTPYRIINEQVCHGCWNDMRCEFIHEDFLWCPRKTKDSEKFECTKMISSKMVFNMIDKVIEDYNL